MECWENIIGVRNDCSGTVYKHYLDDFGVSLFSGAKIADERFRTGRELIAAIIRRGWQDTLADVTIDGFDINRILLDAEIGFRDCDESVTGGTNTVTFKTDRRGRLSEFYVPFIEFKALTAGNTTVSITYETPAGNVTETLFTGAVTAGQIKRLSVEKWAGQMFTISIDLSEISVCKTIKNYNCDCSCESYSIVGDLSGLTVGLQIRCHKELFLCKYVDVLSPIAIHRILALFHNEVLTTNRFSEFTQFKREQSAAQIAYHDSSMPIYLDGDIKFSPVKGQYQLKMKNLKLPRPSCPCCMECKGGAQIVTALN